jgi:D-3-phosphoglycerate dehydrogenase
MERGVWDLNAAEKAWRMDGRRLGLVGFGCIGQAVARMMRGWGLRLVANDPYVAVTRTDALGVKLVDLETLCRESDYVSLHVPLLPETHHLLNARTLALMKPGAILINTARGQVLDTEALLNTLDSGRIAMAGLDVFEEEPLSATSPLRSHPRMIVTNHMAWYSEESQKELQITAAEEIVRVCTGGLPHSLANPEVLRRLGRFAEWTPSESVRWKLKRLENLNLAASKH